MALLPPPKGNGFLCHKNFMNHFIYQQKLKLKANKQLISQVMPEIAQINFRRLYFSAWIALAVNLIHVLWFYLDLSKSNEIEYKWRIGVILAHGIMALIMFLGAVLLLWYKNKKSPLSTRN